VRTLEDQVKSSLMIIDEKENDIEKFIYIRSLYDRNVVLAHAVIASDVTKFLPIIYTPTVGLACQQYSKLFRAANGIHFYPGGKYRLCKICFAELYRSEYRYSSCDGQPGNPWHR